MFTVKVKLNANGLDVSRLSYESSLESRVGSEKNMHDASENQERKREVPSLGWGGGGRKGMHI